MDLQARKKAFILNFLQLESEKVIVEFEKLLIDADELSRILYSMIKNLS